MTYNLGHCLEQVRRDAESLDHPAVDRERVQQRIALYANRALVALEEAREATAAAAAALNGG
jgi:hypothetical protein